MQDLFKALPPHFSLSEIHQQRPNLAFVNINTDQFYPLLQQLRDQHGFTHLVLLTAVDWLEEGEFQLTYLLSNRKQAQDIGVRVRIDRENATMQTIHDLWPTAATYQRELKEMFGIDFPYSPGVDDDFILEGWQDIPPYRRDFDTLKYSAESYNHRPGRETRDPVSHMQKQLYPRGR